MNSRLTHIFLLLALGFTGTKAFSKNYDINQKVLKDFSSTRFFSVHEIIKKNNFAVLFQPNCSSCKRQIKDLDCLKDLVSEVVLVGSFGTIKNVRRSYMKKNTDFKGFYIASEQVSRLGFEEGIAPQSIYYSKDKSLRFTGYESCKKIAKKIRELNGNS